MEYGLRRVGVATGVKKCLGWHFECSARQVPTWRISANIEQSQGRGPKVQQKMQKCKKYRQIYTENLHVYEKKRNFAG